MNRFWKKHKGAGSTVLLALLVMGVVIWYESGFYDWNLRNAVRMLSDGMFVPGVALACVGAVLLVAGSGGFDGLAYIHYTTMRVLSPGKKKFKSRKQYLDYKMEKEKKRAENGKPPKYILGIGAAFLGMSILLAMIFLLL